jgi:hypothetical protein
MLPRLRFVVAAAFIAALPWLLLGSGIVSTAQVSSLGEYFRRNTAGPFAAGDLRDDRHMFLLSYVRRSHELERLRELASAPLSDWVAAPSGGIDPVRAAPDDRRGEEVVTEIASLPPDPVAAEAPPNGEHQLPPDPDNARQQSRLDQTAEPVAMPQLSALETTDPVQPGFVAPLPRAKPTVATKRTYAGRLRGPRAKSNSRARLAPIEFNPFGGPPASPTLTNLFAQRYGTPQ